MKINLTSSVIFLVDYVNSHPIILETIYFLSLCWKTYHKINHTNLDKAKSFINMTELILKIWMVGNIHLSLQEIFKLFLRLFEFLMSSECYFFSQIRSLQMLSLIQLISWRNVEYYQMLFYICLGNHVIFLIVAYFADVLQCLLNCEY